MLSEDKFKLGAFGAELPVDFINKFVGAARDRNLSNEAIHRVISYYNARESMVGYQRVLSGSGRSSEKAMQLNLDALPDPLKSPAYARDALNQFYQNLTTVGRGLPHMKGTSSRSVSSHASPHSSRMACFLHGHEPNRYRLMDDSAVNEHPSRATACSWQNFSSHSEVVHRALCRHRNGATVITSTETIVGPDLRVTEGLNHA
jgi:hypothetical protein